TSLADAEYKSRVNRAWLERPSICDQLLRLLMACSWLMRKTVSPCLYLKFQFRTGVSSIFLISRVPEPHSRDRRFSRIEFFRAVGARVPPCPGWRYRLDL